MSHDLDVYMSLKFAHLYHPNFTQREICNMLARTYDLEWSEKDDILQLEVNTILKKAPPMQLQVQYFAKAHWSGKDIAETLGISEGTVSYHKRSNIKKRYENIGVKAVTKYEREKFRREHPGTIIT